MQILLGYLIIYLSIIFGSIFISKIFNKRIESCIVIDILLKMVLLYLFGLIGCLAIGTVIINITFIVLGIITLIKNKKNKNFKDNISTYGLIFFTILYFAFIIFTLNKMSNIWDEFSYWSTISKRMFNSNLLVNEGMLSLYPPFPTLWQYFFTRTLNTYSQGIEMFSTYILGFSLLLPLFEKIKSNRKLPKICLSIIILCVPIIFEYIIFYQAIYVDVLIGLLIGYIFYQEYNEENKKFLFISLILATIALTFMKTTGFYIALILFGIYIIKTIIQIFIDKNKEKTTIKFEIKKYKNYIIGIFTLFIISFITITTWNLCIKDYNGATNELDEYKINNINEERTIGQGLGSIVTTMFGSNNESFDYDLSNRKLISQMYTSYAILKPIKISIASFIIIFIIGVLLIYKFLIKENERKKYISTVIPILIGIFIYIAFLQLAYITKFSVNEFLNHASLDRYVNTYFLGILIFVISIIIAKIEEKRIKNIDNIKDKNTNFKYLILTSVILLITPLNIITDSTIWSGNYNYTIQNSLLTITIQADKLKDKLNSNDRVYLVNQICDKSASSWQLKYFALPEIDIKMTQKFSEELESEFEKDKLLEIWKNILYEKYDYIFILETDDYFNNFAKSLFKNPNLIKNKTIYKIEKDNNNIKLVEY